MRIKPQSADVYLKYRCEKCQALHIVQREETIFPGGVLCHCGHKLRFAPVKAIKIMCDYGVAPQTLDKAAVAATQILRGYGFEKSEILTMMDKAKDKVHPNRDAGELVKVCLQQVESTS